MNVVEGQRIKIGAATGDRERFRGRAGEVVKLQRRKPGLRPDTFVQVRVEGHRVLRMFWEHELAENETCRATEGG